MAQLSFRSPMEVQKDFAKRVKAVRLAENITQEELASQVGIAVGTVKRFEKTGEIQFNHLLRISLVLGRLTEFDDLFILHKVPESLFNLKEPVIRKRARSK